MSGDNSERDKTRNGRHPLTIIGGLLLIGLAVVLLIFGWTTFNTNEAEPSILQQIPTFDIRPGGSAFGGPLQAGDLAREFVLADIDGRPVQLSDWRGRPVILNFWATWCAPCRLEMIDLQAAFEQHQDDNLMILALDRAESADTVRAFFYNEMGLTFTPLLDEAGEVARLYNVVNYPTSFFVNPDGIITAVHLGLMTQSQIEGYLAETIPTEG